MLLKKNEIEIIKVLIASNHYISTYDIATSTGISRRLVREEIGHVKIILESLGYNLVSKASKGYYLEGKSYEIFSQIQNLITRSEKEKESLFPTLPKERQDYIIKRLIDTNSYIKLDVLADELLVSRSTISNDVAAIRKEIKKYKLSIDQKPNYGIRIIGNEQGKRKVLADYIFTTLRISEMFYDFLDTWTNSSDYEIIRILKNHHIEMSDTGMIDFLLGISIGIGRVFNGYFIEEEVTDFYHFIDREEHKAALEIVTYIQEKFDIHYNKYEIEHIALLLICKRSTKGLNPTHDEKIQTITREVVNTIQQQTLISFNNENFKKTLPLYIEYALLRQKYNEKIRNPLFEEIKLTYPLPYELASIASSVIEKYSKQKLSRSELASFATLFNNGIYNQSYQKKKVILINALGYCAEKLCKFLIKENFYNRLSITQVTQYYKLNEVELDQYDLIISTVPIHKKLSIPYINVTYMITQDDLIKINNFLSYIFNNENLVYYFHPKLFQNHVNVKSKKGAISSLYKQLKNVYPNLKDTFKNELLNINNYTLKVFKNSIGFIKLHKPLSTYNNISIVILEEPILWDNETFQIIILYSCLDSENMLYNSFYNTLNSISQDDDILNKLLSHPSYTTFLEILVNYKKK